jgi:hypothetical protein
MLAAIGPAPPTLVVMLAERISAVVPDMPPFVRRWFLEPDHAKPSIEHQDWDLVIADWDYLPLLIEYSEDSANPLEKRFEALSVLMVLQKSNESTSEIQRVKLKQHIEQILLGNRDFARAFSEWIGGIPSLVVRRMLGEEMPNDLPKWMRDEIERNA